MVHFQNLVAGSGAPGDCDFSVADEVCSKTCDETMPKIDPRQDDDYKEFEDLFNCIKKKCVVQLGACENNPSCEKCCTL